MSNGRSTVDKIKQERGIETAGMRDATLNRLNCPEKINKKKKGERKKLQILTNITTITLFNLY